MKIMLPLFVAVFCGSLYATEATTPCQEVKAKEVAEKIQAAVAENQQKAVATTQVLPAKTESAPVAEHAKTADAKELAENVKEKAPEQKEVKKAAKKNVKK